MGERYKTEGRKTNGERRCWWTKAGRTEVVGKTDLIKDEEVDAVGLRGWFEVEGQIMCGKEKSRRELQLSGFLLWCCCSVTLSCPTLCNPMDYSMPGFPVLHYLPEFAKTHVHWVNDAIQPSHPLSLPSPLALSLSQNQGLLHWVGSLHQVAKALALQLQHQFFQWIFRVNILQDWLVWSPCCLRDSQ